MTWSSVSWNASGWTWAGHHHFLEAHPHHSNLWSSWQVSKGKLLEFFWKGTQRAGSCWIVRHNYVLDHIIMFVYLYIYISHADFWNELRPCFDLDSDHYWPWRLFVDGNPWPRCRTRGTMEERQTDMYRGMNEAVGVFFLGPTGVKLDPVQNIPFWRSFCHPQRWAGAPIFFTWESLLFPRKGGDTWQVF